MRDKLITFIGAGLAALAWGQLVISLDVSSPKSTPSYLGAFLVSLTVALVFLGVEFALKRPRRDGFIKTALDVCLVCLIGSFSILFFLYFILAIIGFAELRFLFRELFAIVLMGFLLFVTTFVSILLLKAVIHLLSKSR